MGLGVGESVGFGIGVSVGFTVGASVGFGDNDSVGLGMGESVDSEVGASVGFTVAVSPGSLFPQPVIKTTAVKPTMTANFVFPNALFFPLFTSVSSFQNQDYNYFHFPDFKAFPICCQLARRH